MCHLSTPFIHHLLLPSDLLSYVFFAMVSLPPMPPHFKTLLIEVAAYTLCLQLEGDFMKSKSAITSPYVIRNCSLDGFLYSKIQCVFHCSPGNISFVFDISNFVFRIRTFLPSRGFISSVNKFPAKILGLLAMFSTK
jgi:hypothetical protein